MKYFYLFITILFVIVPPVTDVGGSPYNILHMVTSNEDKFHVSLVQCFDADIQGLDLAVYIR